MKTQREEVLDMAEDNVRFSITLSPYDFRKLKLWAKLRGRSPAAFAAQIIAARVEANFETINQQLAEYARYNNISVEELEASLDSDS
jgi:hypothetical protein